MAKEKDHEVSMAKTQVKKSIDNLQKVARVLAKKSDADNLPAWVQAKITDTAHDTDATASYMTGGDDDVSEQIDTRKYFKVVKGKKVPLNPNELLQRMVPEPVIIPKSELQQAHFELEGELLDEKKKGGTLHKWFKGSKSKDGKPGWVNVVTGGTCASDEPGEGTPKCVSSSKRASMTKAERKSAARRKKKADPGQQQKSGAAKPTYVSTDPKKKKKVKEEFEVTEARDVKGKGSGKKDACYHKVKSRYSVWPSAYASGALVKCREVGAANWGNKTKKESYEYSNWRDDFKALEIETIDLIKAESLISEQQANSQKDQKGLLGKPVGYNNPETTLQKANRELTTIRRLKQKTGLNIGNTSNNASYSDGNVSTNAFESKDPCWVGYKQLGMKKKGKKMVPNCVKEGYSNWREELSEEGVDILKDKGRGSEPKKPGEEYKNPYGLKGIGPGIKSTIKVQKAHFEPEGELIEDWQKENRKDKTDGMSPKAVKAYRRENPGSKLKTAVTGKVKKGSKDAKRRKSFCSRSNGQRKMHNIDCSKTPEKKICKARKRWKC